MAPSKDKPGRNDPCHCGSGRKYKKCCLRDDEEAARQSAIQAEQEREQAKRDEEARRAEAFRARQKTWEDRAWEELPDDDQTEGREEDAPEPEDDDREWPPERSYPQPPKPPEPTPEMKAFVDRWWDKSFMPAYRERRLDETLSLMDAMFAERPDAVPFLGLEEECLLELQGMMVQAGRRGELADRLLRMRTEFPIVYDQVYGYLDTTLAASLIALGRSDEVSGMLDRFIQYPDHAPAELAAMLDILLVTNRQDDVFALARATTVPCACSTEVSGMGPAFRWLTIEASLPVCERRECSNEAVADVVAACDALDLPFSHGVTTESAKSFLENAFTPMNWEFPRRRGDRKAFFARMTSHFGLWLQDTHGLSWVSAIRFSDELWAMYDRARSRGKRFRNIFNPNEDAVKAHIHQRCGRMFHLDGVQAFAIVQTLYWFAGFLEDNNQGTEEDRRELRNTCHNLYAKLKEAVHPADDGLALFATFPEYAYATGSGG